ncbi:hypothetical protein MOPEL_135_00990 [Mobilicoccus pelagius NBRC 104925]|uniref:Endonuclease/exonuclease/phosphatase domain-containing protein n=2 Tax=Mobilicoccus TaxID=984996 RepID=H5UVV3_9MICO|nr:hypothetical protein MOPEL_135_00990 [Mobilicoccus pelagius NBRC 104925]
MLTVGAGGLALAAVASLVDGGGWLAQLQAAAPLLGVLGILLAVVAGFRRRFVPALVTLVASLVTIVPVLTTPLDDVPHGSRTLSVLSVNTYIGEADPARIIAEVDTRDVDVLVLPEMTDAFWQRLTAHGLRERLPHVTGRAGRGSGMVIATRQPATCVDLPPGMTCGRVEPDRSAPGGVSRDAEGRPAFDQIVVDLPDGTRVKGVHLWSPRLSPTSRWRENQEEMARWIAAQPADRRLVLAGDFNAGRSHPVFRGYGAGLDDSPRGGLPWTRTWPRWGPIPPFVQIDHVLARGWRASESQTVSVPGSDHLGVWTLLTR